MIGTGPYAIYTVNSRFDNLMMTAHWRGMQLLNNDYLDRLTSVKVLASPIRSLIWVLNPATNRHALAFVNMGNVVMNGGVIETSNGAPHIAVHGGASLVHTAGNYSLVGAAPSTIFRIYTPTTNKVQLVAPLQQWMNVPWSDNMTSLAVITGSDPATSKGVPNGLRIARQQWTGTECAN